MRAERAKQRIVKRATGAGSLVLFLVAMAIIVAGTRIQTEGSENKSEGYGDKDRDWDDNGPDHQPESYAIGLWGDLPYSDVQAELGVPNLIADMNSQHLAFSVHDGDLKAGKGTPGSSSPTTCANNKYVQAMVYLQMLQAPAAFTPGDNDWTDCDNATNGPFNSLERLDHERSLFFSTPFTFGQHRLHQAVQTDVVNTPCKGWIAGDSTGTTSYKLEACVENRRWTFRGVTYATLNIQGSCDNRCKDFPDSVEADSRRDADIAWMRETFQVAKDRNSVAVMLISQADPGFNDHPIESENVRNPKTLACLNCTASTPDGFQAFLTALRDEVTAFRKPVAYVHGDTHYFRIDKPFLDTAGRRLENFTRIETFGDNVFSVDAQHPDLSDLNNVHWVKAFVDPHSREVFSFQPQIVPGNRVAVPVP
jgi:hypothetical protein